jgi:hypothetical protein
MHFLQETATTEPNCVQKNPGRERVTQSDHIESIYHFVIHVFYSPLCLCCRCGCDDCIRESQEDSLRFSVSRLNEYRALASPSLIALSSNDPILTAFRLSWELRNLAFAEQESKSDYMASIR